MRRDFGRVPRGANRSAAILVLAWWAAFPPAGVRAQESDALETPATAPAHTTLVYPPFGHTLGIHRANPTHLRIFLGGRTTFDDPQGVTAVKFASDDDPAAKGDDFQLTLFGVNAGRGEIIYNSSMQTLAIFGGEGSGQGRFREPRGIAAHPDGRVYVADLGNGRVVRLRWDGLARRLVWVGAWAAGTPHDVAVDNRGNVFAADRERDLVLRFADTDAGAGTPLLPPSPIDGDHWPLPADVDEPVALAVADSLDPWYRPDHYRLYLVDQGGGRLRVYDAAGRVLAETTPAVAGPGPGRFGYLALDFHGNVYVTDPVRGAIVKLDPGLGLLDVFSGPGDPEAGLDEPRGIAIWRRFGQVFVAERQGAQYFFVGADVRPASGPLEVRRAGSAWSFQIFLTELAHVTATFLDASRDTLASVAPSQPIDVGDQVVAWDASAWQRPPTEGWEERATTLVIEARPTYSSRKKFARVREFTIEWRDVSSSRAAGAAPLGRASRTVPLGRATTCADEPVPGEPHPDLYCVPLVPTAMAGAAAGAVRLLRHPSPFGVSVTPGGVQRWDLAISLADLPDPSSLGSYTSYVAWATTPILEPIVKLGVVGEGEALLGPVAFNQFLILISAEASPEVEARAGPLVLRGASASSRIQPHEIVTALATAAGGASEVGVTSPDGAPSGEHAGHAPAPVGAANEWSPPPMHPQVPMPPALMRLRPDVAPFLPAAEAGIPAARAAALVDIADGDTLDLVAGPVLRTLKGRNHVMYGFNGMYPGPLIRVDRGSTIVVRFENRTEWPTAIHWHGVRVENRFDGVPHVTQEPIPPGHAFTYQVRFPDAGIYWYHPHHREDVQQDLGLYGNLRVREAGPEPPVHREEILILDDLLIGDDGLVPWGREAATHALMGRFGNVMLVNGEPDWRLAVRRGEVVRFYLTNASNTRTWNVSFGGVPMKLVATDLSPFEREEIVESIVLAPAERYVVDVLFESPGRHAFVHRVQAIDPLGARFFAEVDTLGEVDVGMESAVPDHAATFHRLHEDQRVIAEIDRVREAFDRPPDHELLLTLEVGDLPFPVAPLLATEWNYVHPVEWSGTMPEMNWVSTGRSLRWILRDRETGRENEDLKWRFREGELVKIRLTSDRDALHPMHHPIHLHGQRFLVLAQGGTRNDNLAWKDTFLLPTGDSAEILVEMSNPGRWMLHCHISEHLEAGMQTVLTVDPGGAGPLD